MPKPSARISGILPSGKDGWEVHFAAWQRKEAGEPIIMLSVGDHDFDTPSETVEACVTAVRSGYHHYTQLPGIPRMREAMAKASTRCTGVETNAHQIIATPGGQLALYAAVQARWTRATMQSSLRPTMRPIPARSAPPKRTSPWSRREASDGFQPRAEAIETALKPNTRSILINTPNNPTGAVYSQEMPRRTSPSSASDARPLAALGRGLLDARRRSSMCRRGPFPAWPSARSSSTRCRRATA
jgi:arginine:pyruvate transaminase